MAQLPVVTIDGGAYTGTSTLAKSLARMTGGEHLNTGSIYRAYTYVFYQLFGMDATKYDGLVIETARSMKLDFENGAVSRVSLDSGTTWDSVYSYLYTPEVDHNVPLVGAIPEIRTMVVAASRAHIEQGSQAGKCFFVEGRATGRRDFVDAPLKIWLMASARERVRRAVYSRRPLPGLAIDQTEPEREPQLRAQVLEGLESDGYSEPYETVMQAILRRDDLDASRDVDPMLPAEDAVAVDTTNLTSNEVSHVVEILCRMRGLVAA